MSETSNLLPRVCVDVLLFVAVLTVPWWLVCAVLLMSIIAFDWFIEGVLVALLIDVVFGATLWPHLAIIVMLVILVVEGTTYYLYK